ncbi:hypothetical protein B0H14DRAFT_2605733 [Mycena olivaceomarginata]|nr:hypothetical protein B0H14DRAFT_2605733 [Mycena olivaceomarginata]
MGRFLGISRETDPSATVMSNVKCDMSHFLSSSAFGSHWYRKERVKRVYKAYEKKKLASQRSRPPTAPFDHKNVLHGPMEDTNDPEGAPLRSMYIDDQAEEDTDAEMEDSEADYDDEDSMEAPVRRDEESTFVLANLAQAQEQWLKGRPRPRVPTPPPFRWLEDRASPTPPGQDMEVEQEGETLAGSPSSMLLASELFPQDEESGSETETEEYLPPPSSKTTVACVISACICRYFDEQAEDSDEDAGEEREEEEQEMEEDREFVDDTAVDEDFVHRLPSNKDDAREVEKWVAHFQNEDKIAHYKRDVAREAAGEAGAPSAEQERMLSPRELVLYNKAKNLCTNMQIAEFERALRWEMLADVDVEPHTWVRAPDQFDCRVGFVLTVTDLVVIQRGKASVHMRTRSMSQRWFPKVEPSFVEIALFAETTLGALSRVVLAKPSPALDAGDRVVVTTGDRKGSTSRITGVADIRTAGKRVAMAQVLPPAPKPYPKGKGPMALVEPPKPFEVGLAQLKRHALDLYYHFRIHDRVRVVSGALYVGAIGRVEEVEGDFLTVAIPKDWEVVGATWPSPTSDVTKLFIISIVHVTRQWAIGDSVRVTRGQYEGQVGVILGLHSSGYLELLEANVGYSRYKDVPHSRKVRCLDVDFEHELWTTTATNCLPSASWSESNSDNDLTVSSTLPLSQPRTSQRGFEGIEVIVAKSNNFIALSKEAKIRERSDRLKNGVEPPPERHTGKLLKPVDSTCLRNPDVAGIMVTIRGDHSLETIQVPIENVRHLVQARFFPPAILFGGQPPEPPSNPRTVTYRGPFRSDTETAAPPPQSTTPIAANAAVWGSHPPVEGENNGRWLCQPELVGRRLDVQILGIATLANSTISKVQRTLEGSCGWVLLSEPVTTKTRKVDVCSVGKNQNMYSIDKSCIKPRRDIDSGKWLVEISERVVVIGPDSESDRARTGQTSKRSPNLPPEERQGGCMQCNDCKHPRSSTQYLGIRPRSQTVSPLWRLMTDFTRKNSSLHNHHHTMGYVTLYGPRQHPEEPVYAEQEPIHTYFRQQADRRLSRTQFKGFHQRTGVYIAITSIRTEMVEQCLELRLLDNRKRLIGGGNPLCEKLLKVRLIPRLDSPR